MYTEQELAVIRRIKELLYEEGYTIAGAKKRLASELESRDGSSSGDDEPAVAAESAEEGTPQEEQELAEAAAREAVADSVDRAAQEVSAAAATKEQGSEESSERAAPEGDAVDSELAERVETLERGLRKVLEEVRSLVALLEEPEEDPS